MAGEVVGLVFAIPPTRVSGSARLLLLAVANYSNRQGRRAFPSQHTLAQATGLSVRHVRRLLKRLLTDGFLVEEVPPGHHRPRTYALSGLSDRTSDVRPSRRLEENDPSDRTSDVRHKTSGRPDISHVRPDILAVRPDIQMSADPSIDPSVDPSTKEQRRKSAAAAIPSEESYFVLQRLAHDIIQADPAQSYPDQLEALKQRAAELRISYDSHVIGSALGSALMRRRLTRKAAEDR